MKLIIFDIDGTLTDTKSVDDKCFIKAFDNVFGINIENQDWSKLKNVTDWGITEEIIQEKLNRLPTEKEYRQLINELVGLLKQEIKNDPSQFKEVKNATEFFYYIQSDPNYKVGIATGAWEESAKLKLEMIGINIKDVAFSNSSIYKSREKITKDVIHQLTEKINIDLNEIIYFGDGVWDYKTCKNLGIRFIGIDINNDDKLKKLGAKVVFDNFKDSNKIIENLK